MSPLFKVYKKVVEFSFTPTKIFCFLVLVFGFSLNIQRIKHLSKLVRPYCDPNYSVLIVRKFITSICTNIYYFHFFFRELIKMVEELEKTESTWKMHPSAARNKQLLKKWKSQLKVIKNSINLIFLIGFCIRSVSQLFSSI